MKEPFPNKDMKDVGGDERRRAPRLPVDYDLKVNVESGNVFYTGLLRDISTGGLFIATDHDHRVGERVTVRFSFPGVPEPVEAVGIVRWQRTPFGEGALPEGIGLQLEALPEPVIEAINNHLKAYESLMYDEETSEFEPW
jgi:uncharacterized protein (TIGR02266 family)